MKGQETKSSATEADAAAGELPLTRRERLKRKNNKHLWPQMPKIKSPSLRAKAYLRVSGLTKPPSIKVDPKTDINSPEVKFGRLLGATEQRVRHQAVLQLEHYLKARCDIDNEAGGISELDLMKLWKGLWYTLFMADKVPVQEELASKIADLIWCVAGTEEEDEYAGQAYLEMHGDDDVDDAEADDSKDEESEEDSDSDEDVTMEEIVNTFENSEEVDEASDSCSDDDDVEDDESENSDESEVRHCRGAHLASLFVRTFFRTVHRDWGKLDKWRVDKFYSQVRLVLNRVFRYMSARHWNIGIIQLFNDAVVEEVLSKTPNGLRFHLIDLVLEELAKVNAEAPMPLTEATFLDCMEPYFALAQNGNGDDAVQQRVMDNVLYKFLEKYSFVRLEQENHEQTKTSFDQVHVRTVADFIFKIASDSKTNSTYRKSLYDCHKRYIRRIKEAGRDVELDIIDEDEDFSNDNDGEEVIAQQVSDEDDDDMHIKEELVEMIELEKRYDADLDTPEKQDTSKKSESKATSVNSETSKKQKLNKKKKRKNNNFVNEDGTGSKERTSSEVRDEEITISLAEQKSAFNSLKQESKSASDQHPAKKQKKISSKIENRTPEEAKRVKFDSVNKARSWKVSMKNLRVKDISSPKSLPEKGILRESTRVKKALSNKSSKISRRKASDYF